jgi:CelD/BcsL family acetyltransferase involved in cellulose biosynthesis
MNATLLSRVAIGGLALALLAPAVEARHRYLRPASAPVCSVAVTAPAPVTAAAPVAAPAVNTTRSFSYEPTAPAVATPAVVPTYRMAPAPATNIMRDHFEAYGKYRW